MHTQKKFITFSATLFALLAFAGNSVLCRLALLSNTNNSEVIPLASDIHAIDATSFTLLRLLSGSLALFVFMAIKYLGANNNQTTSTLALRNLTSLRSWLAPFCLFVYAATFSFAYISLPTGAGALVLFGCVQLSMIVSSIMARETLGLQKYMGVSLAFLGLCLLMYFQGSEQTAGNETGLAIDNTLVIGFLLMIISGIAWAVYTLLGRSSINPIADTYANFAKSLVFCIPLSTIYFLLPASATTYGVALALLSGVVSSAMGYAIWYYVLPQLSRIQAGVIQLLVPVIAAIGGFIWAQEAITTPLIIAQIMVLGGITLVIVNKVIPRNI